MQYYPGMTQTRCILASRCLSGDACRWHGRPDKSCRRRVGRIAEHFGAARIEWVCPEELAGLPTPRPPTRRRKGRLYADGDVTTPDLTPIFARGAELAMAIAQQVQPVALVLFSGSPSCDPEWGLAGQLLLALDLPLVLLGNPFGRQHFASTIGRLRQ